jgi:hypothetical protein
LICSPTDFLVEAKPKQRFALAGGGSAQAEPISSTTRSSNGAMCISLEKRQPSACNA